MAQRLAVVIGNSHFEDEQAFPPLRTPLNDARQVAAVLEQLGQFKILDLLLDEGSERIQASIEQLYTVAERGDLTLLYYSGHGYKSPNGNLFLAARNTKTGLLRATGIWETFLHDALNESRARYRVILLDCCFSGTFIGTKSGEETLSLAQMQGESTAILASSGRIQYSFEEMDEHSLFTQHLLEGIQSGQADEDLDGQIKVSELFSYVERNVRRARPQQTPMLLLTERAGQVVLAELPPDLRRKREPSALYENARQATQAGQWQAAGEFLKRLYALQPDYPDPDGLEAQVKAGLELEALYQDQAQVAARADGVLAALLPEQQLLARRIFLRLLQLDENSPDAGRPQRVDALQVPGDDPDAFSQTLEILASQSLLKRSGDPNSPDCIVEIAHPALITGWPQVQAWMAEWRSSELARRRLLERAADWQALGQRGGSLDALELSNARQWLASPGATVTGVDAVLKELIHSSQATLQQAQRAQHQRLRFAALAVLSSLALLVLAWQIGLRLWAAGLSPMRSIQAGMATIGNDDPTLDGGGHSIPSWKMAMPDFEMDVHEVTNGQYCLCTRALFCSPPNYEQGKPVCAKEQTNLPVVRVNLKQAATFCRWLGRRLPVESEWEWAARGPDKSLYVIGNTPPGPDQANLSGSGVTEAVDATRLGDRSWSGVIGLSGNVKEWTISSWLSYADLSQYRITFWPKSLASSKGYVIARGGSWKTDPQDARVFLRFPVSQFEANSRDIGFRCVRGQPVEQVQALIPTSSP